MKKAILLVAIGFSIMLGHAQEKTIHITYYDYYKTKMKTKYQTIGNNVLHGYSKIYYESGPILEQSEYYRGKRTSRKIYTIDGEIILSLKFNNNGIPNGEQKRWVFDDRAFKHEESSATFNNGKLIKFSNHYYNRRYNKLGGKKTSFSNNHLSTLNKSGDKILDIDIIVDKEYVDTYSIGGYDYKDNIIVHSIANGFVLNNDLKVTYSKGRIFKIEDKEPNFSYTADRIKERTYVVKRNFSNSIEIDTIVLKNESKSTIHLKYFVSNDDYTLELGVEGDVAWASEFRSNYHYEFDVTHIIDNEDKSKYEYFIKYAIDNSGNTKSIEDIIANTINFYYPNGKIKRKEDHNTGNWFEYNENGKEINSLEMEHIKVLKIKNQIDSLVTLRKEWVQYIIDNMLSIKHIREEIYTKIAFIRVNISPSLNKISFSSSGQSSASLHTILIKIEERLSSNIPSEPSASAISNASTYGNELFVELVKLNPNYKITIGTQSQQVSAKKYIDAFNQIVAFNKSLDYYMNIPKDRKEKKVWKEEIRGKMERTDLSNIKTFVTNDEINNIWLIPSTK